MQVRAADRSGGHPDNRIARVLDLRIGDGVATHVAFAVPTERFHRGHSAAAEPGCAFLRCISAKVSDGVMCAIAACNLLCQPVTTWPSPRIIASKPWRATSAGSSFFEVPTLVSIKSARSKNSVSVAPGIRQVTVTPVLFSSCRSANEKESRNDLEAL